MKWRWLIVRGPFPAKDFLLGHRESFRVASKGKTGGRANPASSFAWLEDCVGREG